MKKWVEKLVEQFDFDWSDDNHKRRSEDGPKVPTHLSEDQATVLFVIDTLNKNLIEFEGHPVRKVREQLDDFAKALLDPEVETEQVLFRFRQFLSSHRIAEIAYFQKTFEEFRTIIWDFVDQLAEDLSEEQKEDKDVRDHLEQLKEAVESNSIPMLKNQSRKFIDCYIEKQFRKDKRRASKMKSIRKNLNVVKKQLVEANDSARLDHLTKAHNRKSFDEASAQHVKLNHVSHHPITMMLLDIDYFKRINDSYGHDIGDFVLVELVKTLKTVFARESDMISRIGGEEFAILLPDFQIDHARVKAEECLQKVRAAAFVHGGKEIRFTISIGAAQLMENESPEAWLKRADLALYNSKNTGRNRLTLAPPPIKQQAA